jgi:hypothetical protein
MRKHLLYEHDHVERYGKHFCLYSNWENLIKVITEESLPILNKKGTLVCIYYQ